MTYSFPNLYLDFYDNGRRWYEFLNLFLTGDRQRDKETMWLAKEIISQRRLDAATMQNVLPAPSKISQSRNKKRCRNI
jgi:hypothetical protein